MREWHTTPDYIINNWTDELFELMLEKMVERKEAETKVMKNKSSGNEKVSEEILFAKASNLIEVKNAN